MTGNIKPGKPVPFFPGHEDMNKLPIVIGSCAFTGTLGSRFECDNLTEKIYIPNEHHKYTYTQYLSL